MHREIIDTPVAGCHDGRHARILVSLLDGLLNGVVFLAGIHEGCHDVLLVGGVHVRELLLCLCDLRACLRYGVERCLGVLLVLDALRALLQKLELRDGVGDHEALKAGFLLPRYDETLRVFLVGGLLRSKGRPFLRHHILGSAGLGGLGTDAALVERHLRRPVVRLEVRVGCGDERRPGKLRL